MNLEEACQKKRREERFWRTTQVIDPLLPLSADERLPARLFAFGFPTFLMAAPDDFSFLPFGDQDGSIDLSPIFQQCARTLYRQAWEEYRAVGAPYGETDKAMLVWYSFQKDPHHPALPFGKN
jgi:hypothetical protein